MNPSEPDDDELEVELEELEENEEDEEDSDRRDELDDADCISSSKSPSRAILET
jgi:hypothetical protein